MNPRWDLLTELGQHGSVRLFGECNHFYNCANCFQSDKRVMSGVRSSQSLAKSTTSVVRTISSPKVDRQCVDRQRSALPH